MTAASNSEARKRAAATGAHVPTTADVKAAYCVAGMFTGNYATAYRDGLKRFGPEFDAWLAGIAASNSTAPEPTGTLEGAPGADSEALGAREADREALAVLIATLVTDVTYSVSDSDLNPGAIQTFRSEFTVPRGWQAKAIAEVILGSSWLADHDRQTAERAWAEGHRAGFYGMFPDGGANPYSEEAHRG